ncbi:hypothetical protein OH799_19515 [Nocardia sp. NBC_00881]|uniref:hypothetical protein n=1 Tax=Nocardia sp. NBC_00881 TaxID=2975995 RepID=UPI00386EFEDA|nr:hypothetical protein OH799_19515 [Nocardia sp. NBC_00881]
MTARENASDHESTVAEIVGQNAKRLRGDHTAERLASHAQWAGLKWNSGRVADLEAGRTSPTVPTLIALTIAFRTLLGRPVTLVDLLQCEGRVELNDTVSIPAEDLTRFFSAEPVEITASGVPLSVAEASTDLVRGFFDNPEQWQGVDEEDLHKELRKATGAEVRAAKDVGISSTSLVVEALKLWGRGFTEERDARAGEDASKQKRGRIARVLKDELSQAIKRQEDSHRGDN